MKWTWFCTVVEMFRPSFKGGQGGIYFTLPELHFRPSLPSLEPVNTVWGMGTGLVMPPQLSTINFHPFLTIFTSACCEYHYTLLISQMQAKTSNWNLFIRCENFKKRPLIYYSWWSLGGPLYDFCIVTSLQPSANFCLLQITDKQTNGAVSCPSHTHP